MRGPPSHRRTPRRRPPSTPEERLAALRDYAIKLHDRGDGHGVDWPTVAATAFKVAFGCIDEARGDERAMRALRKAEGGIYNRLAGNGEDGTPNLPDRPEPPSFTPGDEPEPGLRHTP